MPPNRDMVVDKVNDSNNTPAASRRLEICFNPLRCGLGSGTRECEAQKFHLYCHDVAFVKVNLHPHRG